MCMSSFEAKKKEENLVKTVDIQCCRKLIN